MTERADARNSADDIDVPQERTRDELYAMVWREPVLRIGERYGVSSSYLTRVAVDEREAPKPVRYHLDPSRSQLFGSIYVCWELF